MWTILGLAFLLGCLSTVVHGDYSCSCQSSGGCNFNESCLPADSCRKKNVAVGKPANISSVYNDSNNNAGPACLAVNGNQDTIFRPTNTHPDNPNCIHSAVGDKNPFWVVNLGQEVAIVAITVYARDKQLVRMGYVNLTVDNEVRYVFQPQNLSMTTEITFDPPISGREVKLSKDRAVLNENDPFLNFCEVQVWGCVEGWEGPQCDRRTTTTSTWSTSTTSTTSSTTTSSTSGMSSTSAFVWIASLLMTAIH